MTLRVLEKDVCVLERVCVRVCVCVCGMAHLSIWLRVQPATGPHVETRTRIQLFVWIWLLLHREIS